MANFSLSATLGNAYSYSFGWPSRYAPSNDGSCGQNVAYLVLSTFDIPIAGDLPPRGNLCGVDINNMAATDAINLSLAENMIDGKFYEMYTDAYGFANFQEVYPAPTEVSLDIRVCVPSSNIDQKADLVIVRGYDTPPVRSFKPFEKLDWDPVSSLYDLIPEVNCHGHQFAVEAWKSYKDPVLETAYKDGVENLYELNAFESLVGYVIKYEADDDDPSVKFSNSDTSTKLVEIPFVGLGSKSSVLYCDESGSGTSYYIKSEHALGNFMGTDIFGDRWPLLLSVQGIYLWGRRIIRLVDSTALSQGFVSIYTEDKSKLVSLPANNWYWELDSGSNAKLTMYSTTYDGDPFYETLANTTGRHKEIKVSEGGSINFDDITGLGTAHFFPNVNGALGMMVDKCIVAVEIDRPSFVVQDPSGDAITKARNLNVEYQPIVVTDVPAPIAYTFNGTSHLIDHTLDLYDADPSTQQTNPSLIEGSLAWLQTQSTGRTVDVSLPFATAEQCKSLASTIYNIQNESINSYQVVCGPSSEPTLGASVAGFEGRINRISRSYTDSSAYNLNVTIGPTFPNVRGWGSSMWQRKTSDVQREGIIVWCAGDSINYRVKVQGLGVYPAVNKTLAAYSVGEKVRVTVHNQPDEV